MSSASNPLPLVYSCSGCSNVAQAANAAAVRLDRHGLGEMSCIAGVAAGIPSLLKIAKSGRPILAIDGCSLACSRRGLENQGVHPDAHVELTEYGLTKRRHEDINESQLQIIMEDVVLPALMSIGKLHPDSPDDSKQGG